jgi:prepilin-type N-terminal cleavage/methylation domain-containing protein
MRKNGFTLVELMIVVSILGILGAIVLPTFQSNAAEAKASAAKSDLRAIRAQIELYKMQHNDTLPGYTDGSPSSEGTVPLQLIGTTSVTGAANASKTRTAPYLCGPYLLKIPTNPFNDKSTIKYSTDFVGDAGVVDSGWLYNYSTGEIRLNYPGTDSEGKAYVTY